MISGIQWPLALETLEQMRSCLVAPNGFTCSGLLSALKAWSLANELLRSFKRHLLEPNGIVRSAWLGSQAAHGAWAAALGSLEVMTSCKAWLFPLNDRSRDVHLTLFETLLKSQVQVNQICLNTASNACGRAGRWAEALHLFGQGTPTAWSYGVVMSAADWSWSLRLFRQLLRTQLELDEVLLGSVQWQVALSFAKSSKMLLEAYCRGSSWRHALQLSSHLSESNGTQVISSCGRDSAWQWALWLYGAMKARALASEASCSAAISACKARWEWALELFFEAQQLDEVTYSAMISAFEQGTQWPRALDLLHSATKEALELDTGMYNALLSASQTGLEALTFHQ